MAVRTASRPTELVEREKIPVAPIVQSEDVVPLDRAVCWYCWSERLLPVRVNSHAASEGRRRTVKEKRDGKFSTIVYGVCCPCAEQGKELDP